MGDLIRFDGKVVLITGAGGGLGRAYALAFAERGAKIVVNDLGAARDGDGADATPAQKVVDEIKAMGGEAIANTDSVTSPEGGEAMVKAALDAFGRLDILINNAGILRDVSMMKMQAKDWEAVLDVHLKGAFCVTVPAFRVMKAQGFGRILFTTSAAGLYGNFGQANYSAAKLGLVGLMQVTAIEGAKYNVHSNAIAPLAASRMTEDLLPAEVLEKMDPKAVSPLVLWLSSEECTETGGIFNMGLGCLNKAKIVTGKGVRFSPTEVLSPEDMRGFWPKVQEMEDPKPYNDMNSFVFSLFS